MLKVDAHDQGLIDIAVAAMRTAVVAAHSPVAVAKRLVTVAVRHRNRGRLAAIKKYPFQGRCEASGLAIEKHDAVLDEMDPEQGYAGRVRWVCHKANNSGKRSCGGC